MNDEHPLYTQVRRRPSLRAAWKHVCESGRQSQCAATRREIEKFSESYPVHLERIGRQLRTGRFKFRRARAIAAKRPGKTPRPIVVAPVESRIVQRAVLDVLQRLPGILPYLLPGRSFGGVRGGGVEKAIKAAERAQQEGARYYLRSDIANFFAAIPRQKVISAVQAHLQDERFRALFEQAIHVELENLAELGLHAGLFPLHEIGVAQGNCLSVLLGNILLGEFDAALNGRGITCLRYIDDFILLGPNRRSVRRAFESAVSLLGGLGLTAYDPEESGAKAQEGWLERGYEFLGCRVIPGLVTPTRAAQDRIRDALEQVFEQSEQRLPKAGEAMFNRRRYSVATTVYTARNMVRGWSAQYEHCNDQNFRRNLDRWLASRVRRYVAGMPVTANDKTFLKAFGFGFFSESKRVGTISAGRRDLGVVDSGQDKVHE